eukprot:994124_1
MGSSFCSCSTPSNMLLQEAKAIQHNSPRQNNDSKHCDDNSFTALTSIKQNKKTPNPPQLHTTNHCAQSQNRSSQPRNKSSHDMDLNIFGCEEERECDQECDDPIDDSKTSENSNFFKDRNKCTEDNLFRCPSVLRINAILKRFNAIAIDSTIASESIEDIFTKNGFKYAHLLDDFHHVRYEHNVDDDDDQFQQLHSNLFAEFMCDAKKCAHIRRYYRDRNNQRDDSKLANDLVDSEEPLHIMPVMELIQQIHVYFIHAYDINRLTVKDRKTIEEEIQRRNTTGLDEEIDPDLLDTQTLEIAAIILADKNKKLDITRNDDKFIVKEAAPQSHVIRLADIQRVLKEEGISVDGTPLQGVVKQYEDKKPMFISDLIAVYYEQMDEIAGKIELSHEVCGCILYKYIEQYELNNAQFIQLSKIIIKRLYPTANISDNIERFVEIAQNPDVNISGKIFIRGNAEFMSSARFARIFKEMPNYNRKDLCTIYIKMKQWKPIEPPKTEDEKDEAKDEKDEKDAAKYEKEETNAESEERTETKKIGVYQFGIQFFFWEQYRYHKDYVSANHANFKDELLDNTCFESPFEMRWWNRLKALCNDMSSSNKFKTIRSNGHHKSIYGIKKGATFTVIHLMALKLYTDYSNYCSTFCTILRGADDRKVAEIAHWAKLLTECVQCYGDSMQSQKTYFRGVNHVFYFEMFVARFNIPTSTTRDIIIASGKFSGGGAGFVLALRRYMQKDVIKFDCAAFSHFPDEQETLCFGGNTVLRITSIRHIAERSWMNYIKYIQPLNALFRMINGLTIANQRILKKKSYQRIMTDLLRCVLCTCICDTMSNETTTAFKWPLYIRQILTHNISNPEIKLRYNELVRYTWIESIFTTSINNQRMFNLSNICALFCNSDTITFLMDTNYILSDFECQCIKDSLAAISKMDIIVLICFKWPSNIPTANKSNINNYLRYILAANWSRTFQKDTIVFECTESTLSIEGQKRFEERIHEMSSLLVSLKENYSNPTKAECLLPVAKITQNDIPKRHLSTVYGFIRAILTHGAPPDVFRLVLLSYAKPIQMNIKYNNEVEYILVDPVSDNWNSVCLKIVIAFNLRGNIKPAFSWKLMCLRYPRGRFINTEFGDCEWDTKDIFEPEMDQKFNMQLVCNAIGRYYASLNRVYDDSFSAFCEKYGFSEGDKLPKEMEKSAIDCMITDFDEDFPFKDEPPEDEKARA